MNKEHRSHTRPAAHESDKKHAASDGETAGGSRAAHSNGTTPGPETRSLKSRKSLLPATTIVLLGILVAFATVGFLYLARTVLMPVVLAWVGGLGAIFFVTTTWFLQKAALVPVGDPRLAESLSFENT